MTWLPIVPLLVIGAFLMITWSVLSPLDYIKQHKKAREEKKRLRARFPNKR